MNKKYNGWVSETKYYLNDSIFIYADLNTYKKILLFPGKYVALIYPFEKMCPNIPFSWFYLSGSPVEFYRGIQYMLTYNLRDDIYFHYTVAQMLNIYRHICIADVNIPYRYLSSKLASLFGINSYDVIQCRSLFRPFTIGPDINMEIKIKGGAK